MRPPPSTTPQDAAGRIEGLAPESRITLRAGSGTSQTDRAEADPDRGGSARCPRSHCRLGGGGYLAASYGGAARRVPPPRRTARLAVLRTSNLSGSSGAG